MRTTDRMNRWRLPGVIVALLLIVTACTAEDDGTTESPGPKARRHRRHRWRRRARRDGDDLEPARARPKSRRRCGTRSWPTSRARSSSSAPKPGPFNDQIRAQEEAGEGDISVIGGLDGEFSAFAADGLLMDLVGRGRGAVRPGHQRGLPRARQARHRSAAVHPVDAGDLHHGRPQRGPRVPARGRRRQRPDLGAARPSGARTSRPRRASASSGFPAGEDGLWHRLFQGYGYPAFTGGVNTTFTGDAANEMWTLAAGHLAVRQPAVDDLRLHAGAAADRRGLGRLGPRRPPDRGGRVRPGGVRRLPGAVRPRGQGLHAGRRRARDPEDGAQPGRREGADPATCSSPRPRRHAARACRSSRSSTPSCPEI